GYHTRTRALTTEMENLTMPVTRNVIEAALDTVKGGPVNWKKPAGIQTLPVYPSKIAYNSQGPAPRTDIFPSWYKQKGSTSTNKAIDKVSGLLATSCTPPLARENNSNGSLLSQLSVDQFYPPGHAANPSSSHSNPTATDNVHSCDDANNLEITLTVTNNNNGTYTISGTATDNTKYGFNDSRYPQYPGYITLSVNGKAIKTCKNLPDTLATCSVTSYKPSKSGSQTVTAQAVDSVLYSDTDSQTVNFTKAAQPLTFQSAKATGNNTTINWTGGSGTVTVTNESGGTVCSNSASAGTCQGKRSDANQGETVTLTDGTTTTSGTVD
ncbi:MAG TPA: hypothetical protein VFW90_02210, partial [Candidatus Saccharimonadales bacterium]|nr:hypothetical protein [Candidatus Saccharimonadales bacterium]